MTLLARTIEAIRPLDEPAMTAARARQDRLTKPPGSLGVLETIAVRVAGIRGDPRPRVAEKTVIVCAGDHGVAARGVSAYPQEVTGQMVANILAGGAAINVLARHVGARVVVLDVGVLSDSPPHPDLVVRKVGRGTSDISTGPAMTRQQAVAATEAGIELVGSEVDRGATVVATGDMGIANTTPSSAIAAALCGLPVASVTGAGTGLGAEARDRKVAVVERALAVNRPNPADPLDVLAKVGGFEIGAIAGVILGAAANRVPVVVDGFISTAGAMVAHGIVPLARDYMIATHLSVEAGHRAMLDRLGLDAFFDVDFRLGEGTGAALALSFVEAACKILDEMATFESAGISDGR
jgi:nicotinate-nucleotide--dimethylbenzimidazole phosphoribosyltransferase